MMKRLLTTLFYLCRFFALSQTITGEYIFLKYTVSGRDEYMQIKQSISHGSSNIFKIYTSTNPLIKDTLITFDWDDRTIDSATTVPLGLIKTGVLNLKDSLFTIQKIKVIEPRKYNTEYLSTRHFKIIKISPTELVLIDLDYSLNRATYFFKKKTIKKKPK